MANSLNGMVGTGTSPIQAGAISGSVQTGQTALGTTQGTAFAITANYTLFSTVALNSGAVLPPTSTVAGLAAQQGDEFEVYNNGANPLSLYPPVGGSIGTLAANTALAIPVGKGAKFTLLVQSAAPVYGAILSA